MGAGPLCSQQPFIYVHEYGMSRGRRKRGLCEHVCMCVYASGCQHRLQLNFIFISACMLYYLVSTHKEAGKPPPDSAYWFTLVQVLPVPAALK